MTTALDLIASGAKKLGAIQSGESLSAADAADSLSALNSMLDSWALDRLLIFEIKQESFAWPSGQVSQTIGSTGNFVTTRPTKIEEGTFFRDSSSQDFYVQITEDRPTYDGITVKGVTGTYPDILFYDSTYPLGVIYVYPIPSISLTLFLNSWRTLQSFANLTTDLALPPGYQHAIEHNLTLELEPIFNLPAPQRVVMLADQSKKRLKGINRPSMIAGLDAALITQGGRADIRAGE